MDLWSRSGSLAALRSDWQQVLPLFSDQEVATGPASGFIGLGKLALRAGMRKLPSMELGGYFSTGGSICMSKHLFGLVVTNHGGGGEQPRGDRRQHYYAAEALVER